MAGFTDSFYDYGQLYWEFINFDKNFSLMRKSEKAKQDNYSFQKIFKICFVFLTIEKDKSFER